MPNYIFIAIFVISAYLVYREGSKRYRLSFYNTMSEKQLYSEINGILNSILIRQAKHSNYATSKFHNHNEFIDYINAIKTNLKNNNKEAIEQLYLDFLPTGMFNDLAINNGWPQDYLKLSKRFDLLYETLINKN